MSTPTRATPDRIVRAYVKGIDRDPIYLTSRELAKRDRILALAPAVFARFGRANLTFAIMASALEMGTGSLRRHYTDLEALLAAIMHRHLQEIATALGRVPADAPDRQQARRAAYFRVTRTAFGFTQAHAILVRERHDLPEDERGPIEDIRQQLGALMAGDLVEEAYLLLDAPFLDLPRIETMFASAAHPQALPLQTPSEASPPPARTTQLTLKPPKPPQTLGWTRPSIKLPTRPKQNTG